jgi:hypothetical protein
MTEKEAKEAERIAELTNRYNRAMQNLALAFRNGWITTEITRQPSTGDSVVYSVSLVLKRKIRIL